MKPQDKPIHINCNEKDIAEVVVMPGDPLRAKYIADNFLTDAKLVTSVRNMFGYTGTYKGKRVTVMGHGMGMASAAIYFFELFYYYNVKKIIRIGTAGVVSKNIRIPEIVIADQCYTESNFAFQYNGYSDNTVKPSLELTNTVIETARKNNLNVHVGTIMTSDVFGPYVEVDRNLERVPKNISPLVEEMESFALVHVANSFNRDCACIVTVVDSKYENKALSVKERQTALNDMITLALDSIIV